MSRDYKFPHTATVWRSDGTRDIHGRPLRQVFTIKCRYEEHDREYINEAGEHQRSNAYIYVKKIDDLQIGDVVIRGDFSDQESPVERSFPVRRRRVISNLRGTREEYRYVL